jgi:hypothetical protein
MTVKINCGISYVRIIVHDWFYHLSPLNITDGILCNKVICNSMDTSLPDVALSCSVNDTARFERRKLLLTD